MMTNAELDQQILAHDEKIAAANGKDAKQPKQADMPTFSMTGTAAAMLISPSTGIARPGRYDRRVSSDG